MSDLPKSKARRPFVRAAKKGASPQRGYLNPPFRFTVERLPAGQGAFRMTFPDVPGLVITSPFEDHAMEMAKAAIRKIVRGEPLTDADLTETRKICDFNFVTITASCIVSKPS